MCVLRVSGTEFEADKYLALSGLEAITVYRRGEPRFASKPNGRKLGSSGFNVGVSDGAWEPLGGQVDDAIAFLKKNRDAITMLRSAPGVESMRLDFPVDLKIDRVNIVTQFEYFPPELVSLAGALGLGIEMSIYPRDLEALARGTAEGAG